MDDNTIQYQERTTTYSDCEVLEKMLELVDETAIDYADFKVAKDYVSLHEELQKCYSAKRKYENDHYLWLRSLGAELKIKKMEISVTSLHRVYGSVILTQQSTRLRNQATKSKSRQQRQTSFTHSEDAKCFASSFVTAEQ